MPQKPLEGHLKAQKRHPRVHKCARTMEFLDTLIIINLKVLKCQLSSPIIFSAKSLCLAWSGAARFRFARTAPTGPPTGRRVPVRLLGQGLTADVRLSTIRPASCSSVGTTAQSITPPKSNSHRSPQSLARARDPHPGVLYCGTKRLVFTEGRD